MSTRGFTLIELVVAIAISSIVVVFAAMFIGAPLDAYDAHSRRAVLVADTSGAWPRMQGDLRSALPNSLRTRRNGNYVVVEMLPVLDMARYMTATATIPITTAGIYRGAAAPDYLSVNNLGTPGRDAYTLGPTMVAASNWQPPAAGPIAGEQQISVNPAPVFVADSPRRRLYFVGRPITYLCDEGLGTLQRYSNYTLAANQTARDTPGELTGAGATVELVTQGLSSCNFAVAAAGSAVQSQTFAARLTTTRKGDVVTLLHSAQADYVP
jgi:MSHA biogenesis protein MshO